MRRARAISAAWTTAVVACATVALLGIALFMSQVHRGWWATGAPDPASGEAPATGATVSPGPRRADDTARLEAAAPEPVTPPPRATPGLADAPAPVPASLVSALRERRLTVPVEGVRADALVPSFAEPRGGRVHEALDIMAAAGTPVLAVEDGTVAKLFTSKAGGLTIYQFDPSRAVAYYYAHLQRYAPDLEEGDTIRRGQVIGYVGSTGNAAADAPHLHFAIFRLGPERRWWEGTAIDPYVVLR